MGVKVPEIKYDFWCERDIRGTNGTKREKYGEKYSGVNAARVTCFILVCSISICFLRVSLKVP